MFSTFSNKGPEQNAVVREGPFSAADEDNDSEAPPFAALAQEVELLRRLLGNALGEMREQVYKTERHEWRESLKDDEVMLKALLEQLVQIRFELMMREAGHR